jgi:UMF1 family MFS transporter
MAMAETPDGRGLWAWALYDWALSAYHTIILTFVFSRYFAAEVSGDQPDPNNPMAEALGTVQWSAAMAVAGVFIAVGGPVLGAIADQAGRRKPWLATFTAICAVATTALCLVAPEPTCVWLALPLVVVAQVGADYAMVFYNAMLPAIAPKEKLGRWSGWGWGLGYLGGLVALAVALGFVTLGPGLLGLDEARQWHVRVTFVLAGGWVGLFALPLLALTPDAASAGKRPKQMIFDGVAQLVGSIKRVRQYRNIARFLVARMLYIDGLGTVFAFGGVYAGQTFGLSATAVLIFGIGMNLTAGIGAFGLGWMDDFIGPRRTIVLSLMGLIASGGVLLVAYSLVLFWIFALALGLFVGPVQAASRSYLARLAPPTMRNEAFGLYALSGKATGFAGPMLVGGLTLLFSSPWLGMPEIARRVGMSSVTIFFVSGLLLLWRLPEAGRSADPAEKEE